MAKSITKDFTKGNIAIQLLWFTLPFMASNALQVLYSTIDMIIVGEYVGTAGLSAVSQSSQIINFASMVCLGFSNGGQVLISQALGAGKKKKMNDIIGTLFSLLAILALFLTAVILLFRNGILDVMNIPAESYDMAMDSQLAQYPGRVLRLYAGLHRYLHCGFVLHLWLQHHQRHFARHG